MATAIALLLFLAVCLVIMLGYPVAFSLGGSALLFALVGHFFGAFDLTLLQTLPSRIFGIMTNGQLVAVPLFVFMGVILERSRIAENLLETMGLLFGPLRGGLGLSVLFVGMLLAASTGIVGATVVAMGLLSLPTMLRRGYTPQVATGIICAAGTLGQLIPPSIILILLADVLSSAYQQAQLAQGAFAPETLSVSDLFAGALLPGVLLVGLYMLYVLGLAVFRPAWVPAIPAEERARTRGWALWRQVLLSLAPPLLLILAVLGSILIGLATPTEAAALGALGAGMLAAARRQLNLTILRQAMAETVSVTSMVFMIFIGASIFSLVFRGYGGDDAVHGLLSDLPGGVFAAMLLVMVVLFILGFFLDFIEIIFVVVPVVGPVLLGMGVDPLWLGIMIAINLQTSFLTPPFGFALFYLRSVAPPEVTSRQIYQGIVPFVVLQWIMLGILALWPQLATWLPAALARAAASMP